MRRLTKKYLWLNLAAIAVVVAIGVGTLTVHAYEPFKEGNSQSQEDETRPYLGVGITDSDAGVVVNEVDPNSPASAAGIQPKDIIQQVDEAEITDAAELVEYILTKAPGDTLSITVLRGEETLRVEATLAEAPAITISPSGEPGRGRNFPNGPDTVPFVFGEVAGGYQLGVQYRVITPEIATSEGLTVQDGALITEVVSDSPAADAGLQVGDIITAVDGDAVDIEHTLSDRLYAYEAEDRVIFSVLRGEETLEIGAVLAAEHPGKLFGGNFPGVNIRPGQGMPNAEGFSPDGRFPFGGEEGFRGPDIEIPFGPNGRFPNFEGMEVVTCQNEDGSVQFSFTVPEGVLENLDLGEGFTCEVAEPANLDEEAVPEANDNPTSTLFQS
jgi:membrane-associated protease RseP (regulator of RpoE activity)